MVACGTEIGVSVASSASRSTRTCRNAGEKFDQPTWPISLTDRAAATVAALGAGSVAARRWRTTLAATIPSRMPATHVVL